MSKREVTKEPLEAKAQTQPPPAQPETAAQTPPAGVRAEQAVSAAIEPPKADHTRPAADAADYPVVQCPRCMSVATKRQPNSAFTDSRGKWCKRKCETCSLVFKEHLGE